MEPKNSGLVGTGSINLEFSVNSVFIKPPFVAYRMQKYSCFLACYDPGSYVVFFSLVFQCCMYFVCAVVPPGLRVVLPPLGSLPLQVLFLPAWGWCYHHWCFSRCWLSIGAGAGGATINGRRWRQSFSFSRPCSQLHQAVSCGVVLSCTVICHNFSSLGKHRGE